LDSIKAQLMAALMGLSFCAHSVALNAGNSAVDVPGVLRALGFPGGVFDPVNAMDYQFDPAIEAKVGRFDRDAAVDTAEELLTALFYSPAAVGNKTRESIERLLPPGREGALRLCSLWLLKSADTPAHGARYREAVRYIGERSKLQAGEILDFYEQKVAEMLAGIDPGPLTAREMSELKEHLSLYMISPSDNKAVGAFTAWFLSVHGRSVSKSGAVIQILSGFSSYLADTMKKLIVR